MDTTTEITAPAPELVPEFASEQVLSIPLEQLRPSKYQPKARKADADLVESVRTHGVIQAGLARPTPGAATPYEIVFGHCRWDASKKAARPDMPFTVRDLSDAEALELLLVENLRRAGLHPLNEAEGYEQLGKLGHSVDVIAERIGKSKSYVYGRLKLTELGKEGRLAFREGKLTESVALYLARVPAKLQVEALEDLLNRGDDGEPVTAREAQWALRDKFMLELKKAPFEVADASLVPAAGPCTSCPKKTGNQPTLFADVDSADVCTDPICYKAKVTALWAIRVESAKAKGQEIITDEKRGKEIWPQKWDASPRDGFVALDDICPPVTLARNPHTEEMSALVEQSAAMKVLKAKGALPKDDAPTVPGKPAKAQKAEAELAKKLTNEALTAIALAASREITLAGWRLLYERLADRDGAGEAAIVERHCIGDGKGQIDLKKLTVEQLRGLTVDLILTGDLALAGGAAYGELHEDLGPACKAFGVDLKAIEKRLAAAQAAGEKAAAAAKPKKGKAK